MRVNWVQQQVKGSRQSSGIVPPITQRHSSSLTSPTLTADSLKMKCTTAPFFGSDIADGFGEVPAMAVKVLSVVLALAIRLVLRFSQDDGSVQAGALAVTPSIFDANL